MSLELDPLDDENPSPSEQPVPEPPPVTPGAHRPARSSRVGSLRAQLATVPPAIWLALGVVGTLLILIAIVATASLMNTISKAPTPTPVPTVAAPILTASPTLAVPGQAVTINGLNLTPNDLVTAYLRDPSKPSDPILLVGKGTVSINGLLSIGFSYPTESRWATLSRADVIVQSSSNGTYWTVGISVQPSGGSGVVTLPPQSATPLGGIGTRLPMATLTPPRPVNPTLIIPSVTPFATWTLLPPTVSPTISPTPVAPTITPTPVAPSVTPTPVITEWRGEYFNNPTLSGTPVLVRNDGDVKFNWGRGAPDARVPVDNFSARWTRTLGFEGKLYRFSLQADDGVRLWIDDVLVIDEWHPATPLVYSRDVSLSAGLHNVRIEYYEGVFDAYIFLQIEPIDKFNGWKGEYYDNAFLGNAPRFIRDDASIGFDWGGSAPGAGMPNQNWSARWTRRVQLAGGVYRFSLRADDGVRLVIDNNEIINEWHSATGQTYTRDVNLAAGLHDLEVEYYQLTGGSFVWFTYQTPPLDISKWRAEYYSNDHWAGFPTLIRNEDRIDFDWGSGSPDPLVPADHFSARYSRSFDLPAGQYQFDILVDDGIRFYVDNQLMLDQVKEQAATPYTVRLILPAGKHDFRIDYTEYAGMARLAWTRTSLSVTPVPSPTPQVTAGPPLPVITQFDIQPRTVTVGACININWQIGGGAVFARLLRNGALFQDNVPLSNTTQDCPGTPSVWIYRLEALNSINQSATREISVTVESSTVTITPTVAASQPVINSFTTNVSTITLGQCVDLTWSTSGVNVNGGTTPIRMDVDGQTIGTNLAASGSAQHCPATVGARQYALIISPGGGQPDVSQSVTVTVNAAP